MRWGTINLGELAQLFARWGLAEEFREQLPLFLWEEAVGPKLAQLTRPLRVREGVLFIEVQSPVLAQELELLKERYLKRLNELLRTRWPQDRSRPSPVEDLRFRVSGLISDSEQAREPKGQPQPQGRPPSLEEVELTPEELARIDELTGEIEDGRLRAALRRLLVTEWRISKLRERLGGKRCPRCGVFHLGEAVDTADADSQEGLCFWCQLDLGEARW